MNKYIAIRWNDSGCTDVLPIIAFAREGHTNEFTHLDFGLRKGEYKARCSLFVQGDTAILNYEVHPEFNNAQGMTLGVMRLKFTDNQRNMLKQVDWKPKGRQIFNIEAAEVVTELNVEIYDDQLVFEDRGNNMDSDNGDSPQPQIAQSRKVFIVHGHDDGARDAVAWFVENLGLEPIVLSALPNKGRTIIEKFEDSANCVNFAIVLLTPDDIGSTTDTSSQMSRVRQNVLFELGYLVCKLGRGKVCLLRKGKIEEFSDFDGVIYTMMDSNDGWKLKLGKELKATGFNVDMNKLNKVA